MRVWPKKRIRLLAVMSLVVGLMVGVFSWLLFLVEWYWAVSAGLIGMVASFLIQIRRYWHRRRLIRTPFPESWRESLNRFVPFYRGLEGADREQFENDIRFFISEQQITGRRGQEATEEIKVLIAASAAMLSFGLPDWEWPRMRDVLVYPTAFSDNYEVGAGEDILGMVHSQGPIIFSEHHLRHGFLNSEDAHNVGLHEMAHVMDFASGYADGIPAGWMATAPWIRLISDRLQKIRADKCKSILRSYAGVNEAEFFAVAVEAFFERPVRLKEGDPELYSMLVEYFRQDPATRPELARPEEADTESVLEESGDDDAAADLTPEPPLTELPEGRQESGS